MAATQDRRTARAHGARCLRARLEGAGEDQGALAADYTLDLGPTAANLFEMWRGRDIVEEIAARHFEGEKKARIRDAWDRFCGGGRRLNDARVGCSTAPSVPRGRPA